MLIPAQRLLQGLNAEFAKLQASLGDSGVDGSASMAIATALMTLLNREAGGAATVRAQFAGLDTVLADIAPTFADAPPAVAEGFTTLRVRVQAMKSGHDLATLEHAWRETLLELQALLARANATKGCATARMKPVREALVRWESADLLGQAANAGEDSSVVATEIDRDKLTAYLRERFAEPGLEVTVFQPLAGGFGKQTIVFATQGKALSGEFVMRRDMGDRPTVDNDCHMIRDEYPVITAARARGFPAPEALWLDTEHRLLPGGDFIVMRRSKGKLPGNFFGAQSAVPPGLADALADIMARLHTLPPLTELGDLTDSIRSDAWQLSKGEATARYIRDWYDLFLKSEHTPSPSLMAIYGWLLDNVPDRKGRSSLLHGDVGFHNFLFDGDALSAVLDWEFAHIGDPAEELGMVRVTTGKSIDWDRLMTRYVAQGGEPIDEKTLRYFQVWGYARNATAANLVSTLFVNGRFNELKLAYLPVAHFPMFIRGAQALIDAT